MNQRSWYVPGEVIVRVKKLLRVTGLAQSERAISVGCEHYSLGTRHWESQGTSVCGREAGRSRRMKRDGLKGGVSERSGLS